MDAVPRAAARSCFPPLLGAINPVRWSAVGLLALGAACFAAQAAPPRPAVDLIVQVRVISEADASTDPDTPNPPSTPRSVSLSSNAPSTAAVPTQALRVHNGEQASMSWSQTLPIQWMQAAMTRGSTAGNSSRPQGGVVNAVVWLRAGQSLTVQPSWPGGRQPVRVALRLDTDALGERDNAGIPSAQRQSTASTLSVPMGRWTTFAATGTEAPAPSATTWSTQPASGRQLMQLRVLTD